MAHCDEHLEPDLEGDLVGVSVAGPYFIGLGGAKPEKKQDAVSTLWVHHLQGQALELSAMQGAWQENEGTWAY